METKLHLSVEAPGEHLVIDGSLVLLSQLLEALKDRAPAKEQRSLFPSAVEVAARERRALINAESDPGKYAKENIHA